MLLDEHVKWSPWIWEQLVGLWEGITSWWVEEGPAAGEPDRRAARATARVLELRQRRDHWQRLRVSTATRVALCKGGGSSDAAKVMASA